MSDGWSHVKNIVETVVGGSLIVQPSSSMDFKNAELRPLIDKLYRGSNGIEAEEKIKVIKLLWDAIGTEYGGRHELYERNYSGNNENIRMENLIVAQANGNAQEFEDFVQQCMDDYDLDGWVNPTWINNDDIQVYRKK